MKYSVNLLVKLLIRLYLFVYLTVCIGDDMCCICIRTFHLSKLSSNSVSWSDCWSLRTFVCLCVCLSYPPIVLFLIVIFLHSYCSVHLSYIFLPGHFRFVWLWNCLQVRLFLYFTIPFVLSFSLHANCFVYLSCRLMWLHSVGMIVKLVSTCGHLSSHTDCTHFDSYLVTFRSSDYIHRY